MFQLLDWRLRLFCIFCFILSIGMIIGQLISNVKTSKKLKTLVNDQITLTPKEFFNLRNRKTMDNKQHISSSYSITGVYVLFNETKNLVYVGQGKNVLSRVNSHFTGSGNGDVYADYKYGDEFKIKLVSLVSSGYASLNDLERAMINTYNSYERGYNRNRGNRR